MIRLQVKSRAHQDLVEITHEVRDAVSKLPSFDGAVMVFVPHTTAGVMINENADPDVVTDMLGALETAVPWDGPYRHGEGNSAGHLRTSLTGTSQLIPVENGKLQLGTWQGIFLTEYDGPRTRKVFVQPLPGL